MANNSNSTNGHAKCQLHLLFDFETELGNGFRGLLYFMALGYCFIGLSAITDRFFGSMENVVKHSQAVEVIDPRTNTKVVRHEKVWNYTIADIALLAFGTSFPQISLATIDAIRNLGSLYAGGLGPGTLVGSAAFDLFPIHAVCVVVPKAGELKKISDIGVWLVELFWSFWAYVWLYIILEVWTPNVITLWEALFTVLQFGLLLIHAYAQDKRWPYVSLPLTRDERPEEWVPAETGNRTRDKYSDLHEVDEDTSTNIVDIFSIHSGTTSTGYLYESLPNTDITDSSEHCREDLVPEKVDLPSIWRQQFIDALMFSLSNDMFLPRTVGEARIEKIKQYMLTAGKGYVGFTPRTMEIAVCLCTSLSDCSWMDRFHFLFSFHQWYSLHCDEAHGSNKLCYRFTLADDFYELVVYDREFLLGILRCINPYVIAFTALAAGTSWPDLVASKIAAERQLTADSAIANITCSGQLGEYIHWNWRTMAHRHIIQLHRIQETVADRECQRT
ncbi:hypothetical protein OROGR_027385 [Orobanche gracilis]